MTEESLTAIEREVLTWPGVTKEPGRFNSISFTVGRREIGHVHRNGVADLPLPRAVHDELIATGRARPHQASVAGVVSVWLDSPDKIDEAIALFRMNYDRATAARNDQSTQTTELSDPIARGTT